MNQSRRAGPPSSFESRHLGRLVVSVAAYGTLVAGCDSAQSAPPVRASSAPATASTRVLAPKPACPQQMVEAAGVCIDRYEAHLVRLDGQPHTPFERPVKGVRYAARSLPGVVPQGYISRDEAESACELSGKRLCSAVEWQTACKGDQRHAYPYGEQEEKGACNTHKPHLMVRLFGQLSSYTELHFNHPKLNREPGFLAKTGEHPRCVSSYGAFDMVGNLHEWVKDDVNSALPKKIPIPYGAHRMGRRGNAVFMGGYFSSQHEHGRGCEYVTTHHASAYHDYSTGFRCCADRRSSAR